MVYKCYLLSDNDKEFTKAVKITKYADEEYRLKLIEEFNLGKKLKHSSIPKFYSYYDDEFKGEIYVVMDYIDGKELSEIM